LMRFSVCTGKPAWKQLLLQKLTPFKEWYLCFCGFLMPLRCALRFWLLRARKPRSLHQDTAELPPSLVQCHRQLQRQKQQSATGSCFCCPRSPYCAVWFLLRSQRTPNSQTLIKDHHTAK
jgi:hypothetical protein